MWTSPTDIVTAESPRDLDRSGAGGFSLVEIMIGVVITGVLGATLIGVLLQQNAFYEENSQLVTAQRTLRGAADRMSADLRMVHEGDVQTAERDRLVVQRGVGHGVVCHTNSGTAYLYFHQVPSSAPDQVKYLEPRFTGSWQSGLSWPSQDGSRTCESHGSPTGGSNDRYRVASSWPSGSPEVGTVVYGTNTLTYEFDTQGDRIMLFRNGRALTGPFEQSQTYFQYFDDNDNPISPGGATDQIASVVIGATALGDESDARFEGDRQISLRVSFRN